MTISVAERPTMFENHNGYLSACICVDVRSRDIAEVVRGIRTPVVLGL